MATEKGGLLKVLVVHGYRQSSTISYQKTGSFRKGLKKYAELVYITAPNEIPQVDESNGANAERQYGWWFSASNPASFTSLQETEIDDGHSDSLTLIEETFREKGPFDGILGFSQGAAFVAHLCALRGEPGSPYDFKFAILCAGFKSKSTKHVKYYQNKITCPTLHIVGETDKVIAKERSIELSNLFENPEIYLHPGGHFLPATASERSAYQKFLKQFQKQ
eukprot:gene3146-3615_t